MISTATMMISVGPILPMWGPSPVMSCEVVVSLRVPGRGPLGASHAPGSDLSGALLAILLAEPVRGLGDGRARRVDVRELVDASPDGLDHGPGHLATEGRGAPPRPTRQGPDPQPGAQDQPTHRSTQPHHGSTGQPSPSPAVAGYAVSAACRAGGDLGDDLGRVETTALPPIRHTSRRSQAVSAVRTRTTRPPPSAAGTSSADSTG